MIASQGAVPIIRTAWSTAPAASAVAPRSRTRIARAPASRSFSAPG